MTATISDLLEQARAQLDDTSSEARLDAEVLLCHALDKPRSFLRAWPEFEVEETIATRYEAFVERRHTGEPLAYITGEREFWSLPLKLNQHTLIPRPETELLVEQALARIPHSARMTVVDIGTGSGAIALAIAHERPRCRIIATDVSREALDIASDNAAALGIENVEFRHGSWLEPVIEKNCDLILSNPPYIAEADPHLDVPELGYEPRRALVSGPDGLEAINTIANTARSQLAAGATLILEHGYDQKDAVSAIFRSAKYRQITCYKDYSGQDRATSAIL